MDRTIVIGVGGTGLQVIRAMRRQLIESDNSLDLESLSHVAFLYLDTTDADINDSVDNRAQWEVMGKSTMLRPSEYLIFQMADIGRIVDDIDAYPHIKEWLPVDQLRGKISAGDKAHAAQQIRALGRLAFAVNQKKIESAFRNALNSLRSVPGARTKVHIVGSLSGGTGSGMFLDVAYSVADWAGDEAIRIGYLVFPSLDVDRGPRYQPNAYAALMELNYYNLMTLPPSSDQLRSHNTSDLRRKQPKQIQFRRTDGRVIPGAPFSFSYIVSPRNQAGARLSLDSLPEMIARRISLDLDDSFSATAEFLTENGRTNMSFVLIDPFRNDRAFSQRFKSFGFSYIKYPVGEISELLAYRMATDLFQSWTAPREIPGNISERIAPLLHELRLTDDFLIGDKDIFGTHGDHEGFDESVNRFVNQALAAVPQSNIEVALRQKPAAFESEFRGTGAIQFYQVKSQDIPGAAAEIVRLTRRRVSDMVVDPTLGPEYASRILDELARTLERRRKQLVDAVSGFAGKEKNTLSTLEEFYHKLTEAERKLVFREKAVREALGWVGDAMKAYLKVRISSRAYAYAISLLNILIEDQTAGLRSIQQEVHDWERAIVRLTDVLTQEVTARSTYLQNASADQSNGGLLYDNSRVDAIYAGLDIRSSALPFIRERLLDRSGGVALDFRVSAGVKRDLKELPAVAEDAYRSALDWLLTRSTTRISDTNIADKLVEDYPDVNERRRILHEVFQSSAPFLVLSQSEITAHQTNPDVGYQADPNTYSCAIALLKDEDGALANVKAIRSELRNFKTENAKEPFLSMTVNPSEILFLQEWSAFPLRLVADLQPLRDRYREARRSPLPLHIQKAFDPPLADLFVTSGREQREAQEVEEAFFVARALGALRLTENQRDMRSEVRYVYRDSGLENFVAFGSSWDEAFETLSSEDRVVDRDRLLNDVRDRFAKLQTGADRIAMATKLLAHVDELRAACRYGAEDPEYQRWLHVYKRVIAQQKLEEYAQRAGETAAPPSGFEAEVRLAIANYQSGLPDDEKDALLAEASRFGVSTDEARLIIARISKPATETDEQRAYAVLFRRYCGDGKISTEERARLVERQRELGLTEDEVKVIESRVLPTGGLQA